MKNINKAFLLTILLCNAGCEILASDPIEDEQSLIADGVKLISASIKKGDDNSTYLQSTYTLNSSSRLLIRREDLVERAPNLLVDVSHPVLLKLHVVSAANRDEALSQLRVCALTKDWMMLATWKKAHPYGPGGAWDEQGGDYEVETCVSGVADATVSTLMNFDLTVLVETKVVGLGEIYGWIVMQNAGETNIGGEDHPTLYPSFGWTEVR